MKYIVEIKKGKATNCIIDCVHQEGEIHYDIFTGDAIICVKAKNKKLAKEKATEIYATCSPIIIT